MTEEYLKGRDVAEGRQQNFFFFPMRGAPASSYEKMGELRSHRITGSYFLRLISTSTRI